MSDTTFVVMYNPNLGNVQVDAPLQAVATYQSHGWLLLDPNATPPPIASPYLSQPAADSRYLRDWAGAEVLTAGAVRVAPDGHVIVRVADGTTRSTYDGTEAALWTALGGANDPALRAAYARPIANSVVALGTSITQLAYGPGTVNPLQYEARGYLNWARTFLGQRINLLANAGVSGNTTAQMLARVQTDVIALNPAWCVLEIGPNDASTNVAAADTQTNVTSIITALRRAGIRVAVTTPTTTTAQTTAQRQAAFDVARWLRTYVLTLDGDVVLADFQAVYTDPVAGGPVTLLTDDGTHPSADGGQLLGKVLADALSPFIPALRRLPTANTDTANLLTNAMLTGSTGGLATSWAISNGNGQTPNTYATTKVARTDGLPGEWQQIAVGPGCAGQPQLTAPTVTTGFVAGDSVVATIEYQRDSTAVTWNADGQHYLQLNVIALSGSELGRSVWAYRISTEKNWTQWPLSGVMRTPPFVVPAGTTSLVMQFVIRGVDTGTFRFAAASLHKATS